MNLPFLNIPLTTTHCLIGVGAAVGVPIVSCGGYYIYDSSLPQYGDILKKANYKLDLPSSSSLKPAKVEENNKWKIDRFGCFNRFFPGVEDVRTESQEENRTVFTDLIKITNDGTSTDSVGCMLANMSFTDSQHFSYTSEVTFKNDNFGWAIWTHNHRDGEPKKDTKRKNLASQEVDDWNYQLWSYHILFLEKEGGTWKIKGGYFLSESAYFDYQDIKIILPHNRVWTNGSSTTRTYAGVWTMGGKNASSILEGIRFQYGNHTSQFFGNPSSLGNIRYILFGFYHQTESKWKTIKPPQVASGIGQSMANLYAPFKDKKGRWQPYQSYCSSLSSRKRLSAADLERLKMICYTQSGS